MITKNEILEFLSNNKSIFEKRFYCLKIGLFGSFARNEQTEKSDIDIIVVFKPDTPDFYQTEIELKKFIGNKFNRKVDICAEKWIKPIFKPLALKEAIYA
jgi:predicted nucleotidyltransferase